MKRDGAANLKAALALPAEDREALAEAIIASLDEQVDDVEAVWKAEIGRRIGELDEGKMATIPWQEGRWVSCSSPLAVAP